MQPPSEHQMPIMRRAVVAQDETPAGDSKANFGKYRLIAELGHGGMADVFLAVVAGPLGSGFSKLCVVKRLRQNLAEEPEFVNMLIDEARITARLNHPNVVQTNEVGNVGDHYFISMEYLDGQPLHRLQHRSLLQSKPFPKALQYVAICDALAGLHHAHELKDYDGQSLQIVHRDVTPHNIFVTYEGQVKVVDFGIAKATRRSTETRQGVVKGKVRYMAPEQALGRDIDRRADVFSAGVILWEIAVGQRFWTGMSEMQIVQSLLSGKYPASPREVNAEVPEALDAICRRALAANPDERYATAEEFRVALEQFLSNSGELIEARRALGPSVAELFKDRRDELKRVIDAQLKQLATKPSGLKTAYVPIDGNRHSMTPPMGTAAGQTNHGFTNHTRQTAQARHTRQTSATNVGESTMLLSDAATKLFQPATGGGGGTRIAAAVLAIVSAMGIGLYAASRTHGTIAQTETRQVAAASQMGPMLQVVNVTIRATPPSARVFLDNVEYGNPVVAQFGRDEREHLLRIEAEGFSTKTQLLRFSADLEKEVSLERKDDPSLAGYSRMLPRSVATRPGQRDVMTITAPMTPVTVAPARAAESPLSRRPSRGIDSSDPYNGKE